MNFVLSMALVTAIAVLAIGMVFIIFSPMVLTMSSTTEINDAQTLMTSIDKTVQEVARGGSGTSNVFKFSNSPKMVLSADEDAIKYSKDTDSSIFEYFMRKVTDKITFITGSDVSCYESDINEDGSTDLVLENTYIQFVLQKVALTNPMSNIDTNGNIIIIKEKTNDYIIYPSNSSVVIDENVDTSRGTGYSQILRQGNSMPVCSARFYVNSVAGISYDVYYKLYSGTDFIVVDVKNVA
jgi:hypothetical protein